MSEPTSGDAAPRPRDDDGSVAGEHPGERAQENWQRVHILSILAKSLGSLAQSVIPLVLLAYSITRDEGGNITYLLLGGSAVLLAIIGITAFANWLAWRRYRYRIGDSDIRLERGILSREARSIPYDRIQDVSIEQALLPRLLGLAKVKFETGAGGKDELVLAYVTQDEAEALRETVRGLVAQADAGGLADSGTTAHAEGHGAPPPAVQAEDARLLFAMAPRRLAIYGLFSFSLVIFAVVFAALQQFGSLFDLGLEDIADRFIGDERLREAGSWFGSMSLAARVLSIVYLIASIVGVGVLSGLLKTFLRDWDFTLLRTAKGFRRQRGLLTKTDVVMPVHRVQALVLATGWLRRRFGWHGLSFISLAQDSGSANHDVAPFAKMEEIEPIAAEAGFALPDDATAWRRPSQRYYIDRFGLGLLFYLLLAGGGSAIAISRGAPVGTVSAIAATALAVITALLAVRGVYRWRFDRHALDEAQIIARIGWLSPETSIANRVKLHSVEIAQGPLGRLSGYGDLRFGMAGGSFAFRGLELDNARQLRAAVLESIAAVDFAKLPR